MQKTIANAAKSNEFMPLDLKNEQYNSIQDLYEALKSKPELLKHSEKDEDLLRVSHADKALCFRKIAFFSLTGQKF